jgi:CheY-like chemotaxis protein
MKNRVLMIDDEEDLVWTLSRQIARERHDIDFEGFTDPLSALQRINEAPPDLLITDLRMPDMSGLDLMLKARAVSPNMPVILITAYGSTEVKREVMKRSSIEYLEKPFDLEIFLATIDMSLKRNEGFSGSISLQMLPDLIQLYALSQATGALLIKRGREHGSIWFERGDIVHSEYGEDVGQQAFFKLLKWQGGEFSMEPGKRAPRVTINMGWQELLIEGYRLIDEDASETRLESKEKRELDQAVVAGNRETLRVSEIISNITLDQLDIGETIDQPADIETTVQPTNVEIIDSETIEFPPLPKGNSPDEFIWPVEGSLSVIQSIPKNELILRTDLIGQSGRAGDESYKSDVLIYQAGPWCLRTSLKKRYPTSSVAVDELLQLSRMKDMLGPLNLAETVLAVVPDSKSVYWLWTITPWLSSLASEMDQADKNDDESGVTSALVKFAYGALDSLLLASRKGIALDVHPSNYATYSSRIIYIGDDISKSSQLPSIGYALLSCVNEYVQWQTSVNAYLETLISLLTSRLSRADVERLDLVAAIDDTPAHTKGTEAARLRLTHAVMEIEVSEN